MSNVQRTVLKKDANVDLNASGQEQPPVQPASAPKRKAGSWECEACYVNNNADTLYCIACESPKDGTVPKKENKSIDLGSNTGQTFSFGIPATGTPAAAVSPTTKPTEFIFGAKAQTVTCGFTFRMPQIITPVTTGFTFGMSKVTEATTTTATTTTITTSETTPLNLAQKTTFAFSLNKPADDSTVSTTTLNKDAFTFGSANKYELEFKPRSPRKVSSGDGDGDGDAESDASGVEEECNNIYFEPVVPLPDKVDVKTGEEDEEALYCHRAKLFRFCTGEWKERGTGDVKILKNNQTGKLKVVMRREQDLKICLNHVLTNDIDYTVKDDRTWLFSAADYSDGEIAYQQFCLRFRGPEVAQEFMKAITDARSNTTTSAANTTSASANDLQFPVSLQLYICCS